jgi:hypothetical protein
MRVAAFIMPRCSTCTASAGGQLRALNRLRASHLVGHFREDLRLEQELVQPLEILLHHDNASSGVSTTLERFLLQQFRACRGKGSCTMNGLIYLIGLIVVIMFILSLLGLR